MNVKVEKTFNIKEELRHTIASTSTKTSQNIGGLFEDVPLSKYHRNKETTAVPIKQITKAHQNVMNSTKKNKTPQSTKFPVVLNPRQYFGTPRRSAQDDVCDSYGVAPASPSSPFSRACQITPVQNQMTPMCSKNDLLIPQTPSGSYQ